MRKSALKHTVDIQCICCGSEQWEICHRLPSFLFGEKAVIFSCSKCGCGCTYPQPDSPSDYYEDNEQYVELFSEKEDLYSEFARQLLATLEAITSLRWNTLLDVGCGGGFLVQVACEKGFSAEGVEANKELVARSVSKGLNVTQKNIQQLIEENRRYDVIVLSSILEHLIYPIDLLALCRKLVTTNGVLLVSQASYDGLLPKLFPWGWYGWQPQEHYWHFTPNSFSLLAEQSGYKTILTKRRSLYHPWFVGGGAKVIIGRNLATFIGRAGSMLGCGDSFDCVLRSS